jgi:hypothetical protein
MLMLLGKVAIIMYSRNCELNIRGLFGLDQNGPLEAKAMKNKMKVNVTKKNLAIASKFRDLVR